MSSLLQSTFESINPATGFIYSTLSKVRVDDVQLDEDFASEDVESNCHGLVSKRAPHDKVALRVSCSYIFPKTKLAISNIPNKNMLP